MPHVLFVKTTGRMGTFDRLQIQLQKAQYNFVKNVIFTLPWSISSHFQLWKLIVHYYEGCALGTEYIKKVFTRLLR